jgi:hypothetical protein
MRARLKTQSCPQQIVHRMAVGLLRHALAINGPVFVPGTVYVPTAKKSTMRKSDK